MKPKIAIIGAGLSGITLARALQPHAQVSVFEKSRGVGGRMSTRYADPFYFDHGTQYFTARSKAFRAFIAPFQAQGIINEWTGKVVTLTRNEDPSKRLWFEPHYVASPRMNSWCKTMAQDIEVTSTVEVAPLTERADHTWNLKDSNGRPLGEFDWVLSTAPPSQTQRLFQSVVDAPSLPSDVTLHGCYALMLGFNRPWDKSWIAAKVNDSPLSWISVDNTKPGRNADLTTLVLHSRNDWAEEHIDDALEDAQRVLLHEFEAVTGIKASDADHTAIHRWRYALVADPTRPGPWHIEGLKLGAVSDWAMSSRIEEVWYAANELAERVRLLL